jgi:two-component system chemotaxis response regulator CheY
MRILLVDDSATMRRIQKTQLMGLGMTDIVEAENGKAGYDALTRDPAIEMMFLDWNMPEMDGITLLRNIRANQSLNHVKICMCTSEADKSKVMEALKEGANNYIVKPFTPEILKEKLGIK